MNFKELLKKYWFVGIVGIVLVVFITIYSIDAYKNKPVTVQAKQEDGKSVVLTVDGENIYADDLYETLYASTGLNVEYQQFKNAVLNECYETTDEMSSLAANYASYMYSYYTQYYGADYLDQQLKSMGYTNGADDLTNFYINQLKSDKLLGDFLRANWDTYCKDYVEENDPRIIYHILVKVTDVDVVENEDGTNSYVPNPEQEDTDRLNTIIEELKTKEFEEVAYSYSDDSSATNGGYIGCVSNANSGDYYVTFAEESMKLQDDEVSEPVASQAGYHIIWNAGSDVDTLLADSSFLSEIDNLYPTIDLKALMEKANELGLTVNDQKLLDEINLELESEAN